MPYRAAKRASDAFIPALGWTRRAAIALAVLGAAPPAVAIRDMVVDHDCDKQATPHLELVALVVVIAAAAAWTSVKTQRLVARAIARRARVRSAVAGVLVASLALAPAVAIELVSGVTALAIAWGATFHMCFDFDPTRAFFPLGC